ncbi:hypothetical protein HMPREF9123_0634 [Neisseria bacilliformis ATCC BAA-1200]|uniref:Uncharacterized protein n=1 Tax=Neisseria bacilliformis ATCC BAA-1200 TaxID=888742 RepID=F2BAG2_9NEIS|nr:hypothetical protein HMPREF9123_0634 [Neisseria bacilliformis ATCC BAA-1200]
MGAAAHRGRLKTVETGFQTAFGRHRPRASLRHTPYLSGRGRLKSMKPVQRVSAA